VRDFVRRNGPMILGGPWSPFERKVRGDGKCSLRWTDQGYKGSPAATLLSSVCGWWYIGCPAKNWGLSGQTLVLWRRQTCRKRISASHGTNQSQKKGLRCETRYEVGVTVKLKKKTWGKKKEKLVVGKWKVCKQEICVSGLSGSSH